MSHDIDSALAFLSDLQNRPSGTIRITTVEDAAKTILLPAMRTFLNSHRQIDIQLTIHYGLTDVVSERFDAGVRLGGETEEISLPFESASIPMAIVGSPDYFLAEVFERQCDN
ncbi:LysR substrate-binding domain-containing protein [Shigella boydii]